MACSIFFVLFPASRSRGRPTDRTRGDPFGWSRATRHSTTRGAVPPRGTSSRRRWTPKRRYCDGSSPTRRVRASREDARGSRARARSSSLARAQPRRVRLDLNARSPRLLPRPRRFPSPGAALLSRVLIDPTLTGIPFVDDHGALRPGQLLEVCGVGGSGKTEILMRAAVNCVMPLRAPRRAIRRMRIQRPPPRPRRQIRHAQIPQNSHRARQRRHRARGGREEPRGGGELARRRARG